MFASNLWSVEADDSSISGVSPLVVLVRSACRSLPGRYMHDGDEWYTLASLLPSLLLALCMTESPLWLCRFEKSSALLGLKILHAMLPLIHTRPHMRSLARWFVVARLVSPLLQSLCACPRGLIQSFRLHAFTSVSSER